MSRQQGRRERPAVERRAMVEKYSTKKRRRRDESTERSTRSPVTGVRWGAVLSATLISIVTYGLVANAVVQASDGNTAVASWSVAAGAALIPVIMVLLAWLTGMESVFRVAALASAAVVAGFLIGSFLAQDIATGFVIGLGLGAVYAMRLDPSLHDRRWRLWTIAGLAVYTKVVYLISPGVAVVAAPLLPILGVSIVDSVTERRSARQ